MCPNQLQIVSAAGAAIVASLALAAPPSLDFNVVDDPSYQRFRDAVSASEYVRYDYANDRSPRVVGAVTGLLVYATRNPLASEQQLADFLGAFDAALAGAAPGDPELSRSSNFLSGVRFATPLGGAPSLAGTDTDVGGEVLDVLGIDVPPPSDLASMQQRMVRFDLARVRSLANTSEWSSVLVVAFSGQDLNGVPNPHIAGVVRSYLESEGYEPVPDGVDDARFADVDAALATMPADFATYSAVLAEPVETSPLWSSIAGAFGDMNDINQTRLAELQSEMSDEPTLIEGVAVSQDAQLMNQLADEYRSRINEAAMPRTIVSANALMLAQSQDPELRALAQRSREFSAVQIETNDTMAGITSGITYLAGVGSLTVGIATGNPGTAIGGLASAITGGIGLVEAFDDTPSPPSAEQLILDEMAEMRDQVEDVRVEMNQRFDRIEVQLDVIYDQMVVGFNAIGDQLGDLTESVESLSLDMFLVRASLERIEDALWGLGDDLFLQTLTNEANLYLTFRDNTGSDFPYSGPRPSYVVGATFFHDWATVTASNSQFAGPSSSSLTLATAASDLGGPSIGRNVNDLRTFPSAAMGLPALASQRVVSPGPWAQGASAYVQLAEQSPWYFAYLRTTLNQHLEAIIEKGEALAQMAESARDENLFNALFEGTPNFDGYYDALHDVGDRVEDIISGNQGVLWQNFLLDGSSQPMVDLWGGLEQDVRQHAPAFTRLEGRFGLDDLSLPTNQDCWDIFGPTQIPALGSVLLPARMQSLGGNPSHASREARVEIDANGFLVDNDMSVRIGYYVDADSAPSGGGAHLYGLFERRMVWELTNFGSPVPISSDGAAVAKFDQDPFFWFNIVLTLMNGENLTGQSLSTFNGMGDQITIHFVQDTYVEPFPMTPDITSWLDQLQDDVWTTAKNDPVIEFYEPLLPGYEALIEAYVTLAMPDLLEQSAAARAALRANPATGELSLSFTEPITDLFESLEGDGDGGQFFDIVEYMEPRAMLAHQEILDGLALPSAGHSYIDWVLGELGEAQAGAMRLAIDDTYAIPDGSLTVNAAEGVMSNDIDQRFRIIEVDAASIVGPSNGSLSMNADGSFTYTPDPGFSGTDTFTYRTMCDVFACPSYESCLGGDPGIVYSEPATVVLIVEATQTPDCAGDVTTTGSSKGQPSYGQPDGVTDITDLLFFINVWDADFGSTPNSAADLTTSGTNEGGPGYGEPDGEVNLSDLLYYVNEWLNGRDSCPA